MVLWTFVTQAHKTCVGGISSLLLFDHSQHSHTNTHMSITNTLGNLTVLTHHLISFKICKHQFQQNKHYRLQKQI